MNRTRTFSTSAPAGLAVLAFVAVVAVAACRSTATGSGNPDPTVGSHTTPHTRTTANAGPMTGLLLLRRDVTATTTVSTVDPSTGRITVQRTFTVPDGVTANAAEISHHLGLIERGFFNSDFSLMAATGPVQRDGSTAAGVLDTDGHFTALTAPVGGYGSPERKVALDFGPDGRLWYAVSVDGAHSGFGSVDPSRGPASERAEHVSATTLHAPNGDFTGTAFWSGSYGPVDAGALEQEQQIFLPHGIEADQALDTSSGACGDSSRFGWQVGPDGTITSRTPILPATNQCLEPEAAPVWPASTTSFLSTQGSAGGWSSSATQIYDNTITGDHVEAAALLPQSDRTVCWNSRRHGRCRRPLPRSCSSRL